MRPLIPLLSFSSSSFGEFIDVHADTVFGDTRQSLGLSWPYPATVGTRPLRSDSTAAIWYSCPVGPVDCIYCTTVTGKPGTITISQVDAGSERIKGTFSFTAYALGDTTNPSITVTNGEFDLRVPIAFSEQ